LASFVDVKRGVGMGRLQASGTSGKKSGEKKEG
jgi:hypothetical protein